MTGVTSISRFGAEAGPAIHVAPAGVFHIGGLTITNSILYGWICTLAIITVLVWVARRVRVKPQGGLIQYIEAGVEFITNMVVNSFDDKSKGRKYVSFFL